MENTELVLSLLIPTVASSVEGQILTLKHTLYKLHGLPSLVRIAVSLGTLKYMQSLESQKTHGLMQSILDGLTETELGELQNLVESAKRLLENPEYEKYITLFEEMDKDPFKVYLSTSVTNNTGV